MGAPITADKIFRDEPFRSIINLLSEFRDGLELKHIQYVIMEEPCLKYYTTRTIEKEFGDDLDKITELIHDGKIRKYQVKQINRTKNRKKQNEEPESEKGKRVRNNLLNFLKKMMLHPNEMIYREKKKYKIYDNCISELLIKSDKDYIDSCSRSGIKNLEGGIINIYGFDPFKSINFNPENPDNLKRFNNAITKFREGINELQELVDESIDQYMIFDNFVKQLSNKRYLLLDKQILSIFSYYLFMTFITKEESELYKWVDLDIEKDLLVVTRPDKKLVGIFKKHFYPDKTRSEIFLMLKGHVIDKELAIIISNSCMAHILRIRSHIVAVIHSGGGHVLDQQRWKTGLNNMPRVFSEANKLFIKLCNSHRNYLEEYYNFEERTIELISKKVESKFQKTSYAKDSDNLAHVLKRKNIKNIDDWLIFIKQFS